MKLLTWAALLTLQSKYSFASSPEKRDGCGNADVNILWEYLNEYPTSASSYCASYLHLQTITITTTSYPMTEVPTTVTSTTETEVTETTTSETTITETLTSTYTTTTTTSIPVVTELVFNTFKARQVGFTTPNSQIPPRSLSKACSCFMKTVTVSPVTTTLIEPTATSTLTTTTVVTSTDTVTTTTYKTDTTSTSTGVSTTATETAISIAIPCPNFVPCPNPIGSTPFEIIIYADEVTSWNCQSPSLRRAVTNGITVDFLELSGGSPIMWTFEGNELWATDGPGSGPLSTYQEDDPSDDPSDFENLFVGLQGQAYNPKLECQLDPDTSQITCSTITETGYNFSVFGINYQNIGSGSHYYMAFGTATSTNEVYYYPINIAASCPSTN